MRKYIGYIVLAIVILFSTVLFMNFKETLKRKGNLKGVVMALHSYAVANDGKLPSTGVWSDELVKEGFCTNEIFKGKIGYVLNKNLEGLKLNDMPDDVVFLFEVQSGRPNLIGDKQTLKESQLLPAFAVMGFQADNIRKISRDDFDKLKWVPIK